MEKKFKMMEDHLEVEVTQNDEIFLPTESGKEIIGSYIQTTIQKIKPENVQTLVDFVVSENEKAEKQLVLVDKELDNLKDVDTEQIPEKILAECARILGKSTKEFKQKMLVLNNHLSDVAKKKNFSQQKEYIEKQLKQMRKELSDLKSEVN